jgi:integrase
MKTTTGYVRQRDRDKRWYCRVSYTDPSTGKRMFITKFGTSEAHARTLLPQLIAEASAKAQGKAPEPPPLDYSSAPGAIPFRKLADEYERHKVKEPEYRNGRKVAGMRSHRTVKIRIKALVDYFHDTPIGKMDVMAIEVFKEKRLNTPTHYGTERTIASAQRELETLRAIFRFAKTRSYLVVSPFELASSPIISKADETKRDRVLSPAEEVRLLEQCQKPRRGHLYNLVIAALDTGARQGEMLAIRWCDVDAMKRTVTLRAMTTKTLKERRVPLTGRFLVCLYRMSEGMPKQRGGLPVNENRIFNVRKFQNGWEAACEDAKIKDLHWHDLRSTFTVRLIGLRMPITEIAKITGHADLSTLYKHYARITDDTVSRATRLLDGDDDDDPDDDSPLD